MPTRFFILRTARWPRVGPRRPGPTSHQSVTSEQCEESSRHTAKAAAGSGISKVIRCSLGVATGDVTSAHRARDQRNDSATRCISSLRTGCVCVYRGSNDRSV